MADVFLRMNDLPKTFEYSFKALRRAEQLKVIQIISWADFTLARAYLKTNKPDSALYYATNGYNIALKSGFLEQLRDNTQALSNIYAYKKDFDKAYHYHLQYITYRDSMFNAQVSNQTGILQYNYNMGKTQAQIEGLNAEKKNQRNILIAVLTVLALIIVTAILLLRNNRQKRRANLLLQKQKQEIDAKAAELAKQKTNLELLEEIGHSITSSLSVERIISTVYNNVNTLMDANVLVSAFTTMRRKELSFPQPMKMASNFLFTAMQSTMKTALRPYVSKPKKKSSSGTSITSTNNIYRPSKPRLKANNPCLLSFCRW